MNCVAGPCDVGARPSCVGGAWAYRDGAGAYSIGTGACPGGAVSTGAYSIDTGARPTGAGSEGACPTGAGAYSSDTADGEEGAWPGGAGGAGAYSIDTGARPTGAGEACPTGAGSEGACSSGACSDCAGAYRGTGACCSDGGANMPSFELRSWLSSVRLGLLQFVNVGMGGYNSDLTDCRCMWYVSILFWYSGGISLDLECLFEAARMG